MKSTVFGAASALAASLIIVTLFAAPGCGGSDSDSVLAVDDSGTDVTAPADTGSNTADTSSSAGECTTNTDCVAKLPTTTPADCAVATCDTLQKKCHFKAKDADGDGHAAKNCSAATATIEAGDDCDDGDPTSYPGAWDGPATDFDSGAGVQSDRCDQKDNDCNGSPDDGKIKVDGGDKTCKCDPNAPLPCYEYPNGTPIGASTLDSNNNPKGICKKGTRTCVAGVPSACAGAVGPDPSEQCDTLDHDCDGMSGNAGDTVSTATVWYKDGDNDNYGDMNTPAVQACVAPVGIWKALIPNTDCDDADPQRSPGLAEVCDGKDNNCAGGVDENVTASYCPDLDGDTYCTSACVQACPATAPANYKPQNTCAAGLDCNDSAGAGASIHPNATELCGDGVNSNCDALNGDSETYANLGTGCTAGTFGICRRTGSYVCTAAKTSTECNAVAGTATSAQSVMKNDALIDLTQIRAGYDPRWDYSCNNAVTVYTQLYGGTFRTSACNGDYAGACAGLGGESACNAVAPGGAFGTKWYNCEYIPGQPFTWYLPTDNRQCGHTYENISCFYLNGVCTYANNHNATFGNISCE